MVKEKGKKIFMYIAFKNLSINAFTAFWNIIVHVALKDSASVAKDGCSLGPALQAWVILN